MSSSEQPELLINAFDGAIQVHRPPPQHRRPGRAFDFDVSFRLDHPHLITLASAKKPPMHFHPHQEEYIQVLEGALGVEIEGDREYILTPADGELVVHPWANHRLYPLAKGSGNYTRFLLSGEATAEAFRIDTVFFQNWYAYQDEVVLGRRKMDLLQVMNMFDAGGSYLTFPRWVPFRSWLSQLTGIVVGRWLGGILGYQPFHRKWTGDWQLACEKMETSIFLRRFAGREKTL
ncbi:hypothetical protein B0T17DRAFT_541631 [Bombardia bombarda]|uniref:Uncharacterized protein n=1 Tax=Bombardia bombarda TaxID=252184 RepID=A0AA39WH68_9PEZI|nr:hypothetical protein B0T17DRAFT_541631 [Bombardia bombarda]